MQPESNLSPGSATPPGNSTQTSPSLAEVRIADLEKQNAAQAALLKKHEEERLARAAEETFIAEKMRRGITRSQAISVIKRQREYDDSDYGKMCKRRNESRQAIAAARAPKNNW